MYDPSQNEVIQVLVEELERIGGAAAPHDVIVKMGQRFGLPIDESNITTDPANKLFRHKVYCAASIARTKRGLLEPASRSGRGHWMLNPAYKQQMGKASVDQDHIPPPVMEIQKPVVQASEPKTDQLPVVSSLPETRPSLELTSDLSALVTEAQEPKTAPLRDIPFQHVPKPPRRFTSDLSMDVWVVLTVGAIATLFVIAGAFSSAVSSGDLLLGYPAWDWVRLGAMAYLACLVILLHAVARRRAGSSPKALLIIWGARLAGIVATIFIVLGLISDRLLDYSGQSWIQMGSVAFLICAVALVYIIVPKDKLDYGRSLWRNEMWAAIGLAVVSSILIFVGVLEGILGSAEVVLGYTALTWIKIGALGYLVCTIVLLHSIVRQDEESSVGSIVILLARIVFMLSTVVASVGIIGGLVADPVAYRVFGYPVLDWIELGAVGYFMSIALLLYSVAQRYTNMSLGILSIWVARGFGVLATGLVLVGLTGWLTTDADSFLGYDSWGWIHLGVVLYLVFAITSIYGMTEKKS